MKKNLQKIEELKSEFQPCYSKEDLEALQMKHDFEISVPDHGNFRTGERKILKGKKGDYIVRLFNQYTVKEERIFPIYYGLVDKGS